MTDDWFRWAEELVPLPYIAVVAAALREAEVAGYKRGIEDAAALASDSAKHHRLCAKELAKEGKSDAAFIRGREGDNANWISQRIRALAESGGELG